VQREALSADLSGVPRPGTARQGRSAAEPNLETGALLTGLTRETVAWLPHADLRWQESTRHRSQRPARQI